MPPTEETSLHGPLSLLCPGTPFAFPLLLLLLFLQFTFLSFHRPPELTWDKAVEPQETGAAWLKARKIM